MLTEILGRVERRLQALGLSATRASLSAGLSADAIRNMRRASESDQRVGISTSTLISLAPVLQTSAAWLLDGSGTEGSDAIMAPIVGYVGADPSGKIRFADGQASGDHAPAPPGATARTVALEVRGASMPGLADEGALVYFDEQQTTPPRDMLGQVVVVQLTSGEVLIKRLFRGSRPGLYDLGSLNGPLIENVEIEWVAEITAIVPPLRARRIIARRGETDAA